MIKNIKYFIRANRRIILIITILLICSIAIAAGVYAQVTNRTATQRNIKKENKDIYIELKNNFNSIFTNSVNKEATANNNYNYDEIITCEYDIKEAESGKYDINVKIPKLVLDDEEVSKINKEIYDIFCKKIIDIATNSTSRATYNIEYVAYINSNIISLVIKCNYKEGINPQRVIIQTYNYDIENKKLLTISDILEHKQLDSKQVQDTITKEIKEINSKNKSISEQGYNIFVRDESDEMYTLENTPNFFLGKDDYLYLVYAYGNKNYTSELDLIIF